MVLTGYSRTGGKRSGGIRSIYLIKSEEIKSVKYDQGTDTFEEIILNEGAKFSKYCFKEDEAGYYETSTYSNGSFSVNHRIDFLLEKMSSLTSSAAEELAEISPCGIVALVMTSNGNSFLVGYSRSFGTERPLRLEKVQSTTGMKLSDLTGEVITLSSTDSDKAKEYCGEIPEV